MDPFQARQLRISQKFNLIKQTFSITDANDQPLLWADLPVFKLKEQINVYADQAKTQRLLQVAQRKLLTLAPVYDILDAQGNMIASLKVQPLKSLVAVNWQLLDAAGAQIGAVQEAQGQAIASDFMGGMVPRQFSLTTNAGQTASYQQGFQPLLFRMVMDFGPGLDGRIGVAAGLALAHYTISRDQNANAHINMNTTGPVSF